MPDMLKALQDDVRHDRCISSEGVLCGGAASTPNGALHDAIICCGRMTAGEVLRYLAEAVRDFSRQQLSLEQVPMRGTP